MSFEFLINLLYIYLCIKSKLEELRGHKVEPVISHNFSFFFWLAGWLGGGAIGPQPYLPPWISENYYFQFFWGALTDSEPPPPLDRKKCPTGQFPKYAPEKNKNWIDYKLRKF